MPDSIIDDLFSNIFGECSFNSTVDEGNEGTKHLPGIIFSPNLKDILGEFELNLDDSEIEAATSECVVLKQINQRLQVKERICYC